MSDEFRKVKYELDVGFYNGTEIPCWQTIKLSGNLHSPPDGRPAHVVFDDKGRPYEFGWFDQNLRHRVDGPSFLVINPDNGVHVYEQYDNMYEGKPPPNKIAFIRRDPETGEITSKATCCEVDGYDEPLFKNGLEPG